MRYLSILLIYLFILTSAVHGQNLTSANDYSQRGMTRFEKNDLDGAIADFTKAIEMNAEKQEYCYYFRGMAHYRKGNSDQAIIDLSKAIAIKPHPRFYDDRGNLLALQGELDRAIADLNKAIEMEPKYAKAYGDRGIVRLMRGENTDAEQDFRKCFELDSALESQFKATANQVRQRAGSRYEQQKPSDVEVVKFNWTEAPSMTPSASPSFPVSSSTVSSSGTRVLADANAKGQPGPAVVYDPTGTGLPPSRLPEAGTRAVSNYKFTASIRNTGSKTIVGIQWAYFFDPKDSAHKGMAYILTTKTNIAPGKEKQLIDSVSSGGGPNEPKMLTKQSRGFFNERVAILRLDYADGSSWQSSGTPSGPKNTQPQ
ncbi:MAG TPA: tetratricopeptide repeat protein [Pyrinomonadaceae bacterium]|nr:tetratricopeptide repeat protein [Pyrinomonadaceae bacterium]